jgi:hypothetical protein
VIVCRSLGGEEDRAGRRNERTSTSMPLSDLLWLWLVGMRLEDLGCSTYTHLFYLYMKEGW